MKLRLGHLYPELLNLYGDQGNVECLTKRGLWRGINIEVIPVRLDDNLPSEGLDIIFSGGGPDFCQKQVAQDLINVKGDSLIKYITGGGVALFVCGSYQLLGHYYRPAKGEDLPGIGALDLVTEHAGLAKNRCLGNVTLTINKALLSQVKHYYGPDCSSTLVGFENHGGRTHLGEGLITLGKVISSSGGNNGEDGGEGVWYQNTLGTYLHGPLLPKNPHLADWLLGKAWERKTGGTKSLAPLNDKLAWQAHSSALRLR